MTKTNPKLKHINKILEKLHFIHETIRLDPLTDDELDTVDQHLNNLYNFIEDLDMKYCNPADGTTRSHVIEDAE